MYQQQYHPQQQRWYSDFSTRSLPSVNGKQAAWHLYPNDGSYGFQPFESRFSERYLEEKNFQPYGSFKDAGRHGRNSRENRVPFCHKDLKTTSLDSVVASYCPGRPNNECNEQKPTENIQTRNNSNDAYGSGKSKDTSNPPSSLRSPEQPRPPDNDHLNKSCSSAGGLVCSGKLGKENCLSPIEWKPLKWSRSGSLSSRGSGLSCSSSSKSMGVDSTEIVAEVHQKKATLDRSPTIGAAACVMTTAPTSSEETSSRKKARLCWGDGLAKFEKQKVDGSDDDATKNGLVISVCSIEETSSSHAMNLLDESPRVSGMLDCSSPATPSSVACSSSPGIEEKETIKAVNIDHYTANLICSSSIVPHISFEGQTFNSEDPNLTSISNASILISESVQPDDLRYRDANYLGIASLNKLFQLKNDVSKALEITEAEIDSLEKELKSLVAEPRNCCPHPDGSFSKPGRFPLEPCEERVNSSSFIFRPEPLQLISSGDMIVEHAPDAVENELVRLVDDNFDSPGSATSKYVYLSPSGEDMCPKFTEDFVDLDISNTRKSGANACALPLDNDMNNIYNSILASNKDSSNEASEVLSKLLLSKQNVAGSRISCLARDPSLIKKKFLMRKLFIRFKEKVLTINYKLFQHFWREGRIVFVRKLQAKSYKKLDFTGYKKHRCSRSQISTLAGSSQTVTAEAIIEFVNGLLSESSFKPYRRALKMPSLISGEKQMRASKFISNNGKVEDPYAMEKERSVVNSWSPEERDMFIHKLATLGKDFRKIASFLDHKTTANCVEFYYKNHKLNYFEEARKKTCGMKQTRSQSTTYLVASGKRWNRDAVAASLDVLGAASAIVANVENSIERQKGTSRYFDDTSQGSSSLDLCSNDGEAVAADVLASICGSFSSEAMSSCITSAADPGDGYQDSMCQRVGFSVKCPLTPEVTQSVDDGCSEDICEEMDPTDWTDLEKSTFIQSVSSYGIDFELICQCIRTKSSNQCKVFFSKARKCLGLDGIHPRLGIEISGDDSGDSSDTEDVSAVETGSVICDEGSEFKTEEHLSLPLPETKLSYAYDITMGNPKGAEPAMKNSSLDTQIGAKGVFVSVMNLAWNGSPMPVKNVSGCQKKADIRSASAEKPLVSSLLQNSCIAPLRSSTLFPIPIKYQKLSNENALTVGSVSRDDDNHSHKVVTGDHQQHFIGNSFSDYVESSQFLRDYPVPPPIMKDEINGSTSYHKPAPLCNIPRPNGDFHPDRLLQTGNSAIHHDEIVEALCPLHEPSIDHFKIQSNPSHDVPKPSGNGNVKLFGKILVSSQQKPNSCGRQTDGNDIQHHKSGHPPVNLKFSGEQVINFDSALSMFDCKNISNSARTFSVWDGNRIHTGFFPLMPEKYPAAFSMPSVNVGQPSLHGIVSCSDYTLSNVSVFPSREIFDSKRVVDHLMNQKMQPCIIDGKKPPSSLFPTMQ